MKPGTFIGDARWLSVRNQHTEKAPSFAAMEVTGGQLENGHVTYLVTRPTRDSLVNVLFANEAGVPPNNGAGLGTYEPLLALCDSSATPAVEERWGTKRDSWKLHQHFLGFTISGGVQGAGTSLRACYREQMAVQIVLVQLTSNINPGGSASAVILWISGGAPVGSTMDAITVYDPAGMFTGTSGDRGYAYYDHQARRWHLLNLQC
jgi:hypothetical protein